MADANALLEMGFSPSKVERAMAIVGRSSTEEVVNWILQDIANPCVADSSLEGYATGVERMECASGSGERNPFEDWGCEKPLDEACARSRPLAEACSSNRPSDAACASNFPIASVSSASCEPMPGTSRGSEVSVGGGKNLELATPDPIENAICDICKIILPMREIENHAVQTGHTHYDEAPKDMSVAKPKKSPEEKKKEQERLQNLIKERRAANAAQAEQEEIEAEKQRRKVGQELAAARQKYHDIEMKRHLELRRKQKLEDENARLKVLQAIAQDKEERKRKDQFGGTSSLSVTNPIIIKAEPVKLTPEEEAKRDNEECTIQIRLTNGETLKEVFRAKEELAAVRLYVQLHRTDGSEPFYFKMPGRVFSDDDMGTPLFALDLVPRALLTVVNKKTSKN